MSDKDNSRDFSDVNIEVLGIAEMNKLELRIEILHKSNWSNETVRAARRSKFMCALVLAIRKVPIYAPGGGDPALGNVNNPSYFVAVSDFEATKSRDDFAARKEADRLVPTRKVELKKDNALAPPSEAKVVDMLNERSPALDGTRDEGTKRDDGPTGANRTGSESQELEEVRGLLRRETTKGRRKSGKSGDPVIFVDTGIPRIGITAPSPSVHELEEVGTNVYSYQASRHPPVLPPLPVATRLPTPAANTYTTQQRN